MIRTDAEYQTTLNRFQEGEEALDRERRALAAAGRSPAEIKRATDPAACFQEDLREEIASYERLRRGDFEEVKNFEGFGRVLIALRVYRGLSQRELADKLGVHESQVSRDERNEYHGVTVERAKRVLEALGAELRTTVVATVQPGQLPRAESVLVGG